MATQDDPMLGVINPDELYTLQAFMRRLGVRAATVRAARRAGLKTQKVHRNVYIYGRHWIDYVLANGDRQVEESVSDAN